MMQTLKQKQSADEGSRAELEYANQFIKNQCGTLICEAIETELRTLAAILKNEKLLLTRINDLSLEYDKYGDTKLIQTQDRLKILLSEHKKVINEISKKGFDIYREWIKANHVYMVKLESTKFFERPVDLLAKSIRLTEANYYLIDVVFNNTIYQYARNYSWEIIYEKFSSLINCLDDQIIIYLENIKYEILGELLKSRTLKEVSHNLAKQKEGFKTISKVVSKSAAEAKEEWQLIEDHPRSLIKAIKKKETTSEILTQSELSQLYWSYYTKHSNTTDPKNKLDYFTQGCYYLVKAIISGSNQLLTRSNSQPGKIFHYELERAFQNELMTNLLTIAIDSKIYAEAAKRLSILYSLRLNTHIYNDPLERFEDILKAHSYSDTTDSVKESDKLNAALIIFVEELLGHNPMQTLLQNDDKMQSVTTYPFRLVSKDKLHAMLYVFLPSQPKLIKEILDQVNIYIVNNIKKIKCAYQNNQHYVLQVNASDLTTKPFKMRCIIDPATSEEVGRFILEDGKIKFLAYGKDFIIKVKGALEVTSFVIENSDAKVTLEAEFKTKNLYFAAKVKALDYKGKLDASESLHWDSSGDVFVTKDSLINAKQTSFKSGSLNLQGEVRSTIAAKIEIQGILEMGDDALIYAASKIDISASALKEIKGQVLSDNILIKAKDAINIRGSALIRGNNLVEIHAKTILSAKKAEVLSPKRLIVETTDNVVLEDETAWKAAQFSVTAKSFINYSSQPRFGSAVFKLKDQLLNHINGVITADISIKINAESVWNSGIIHYGKQLNAAVNAYFVNGLCEFSDIYDFSKKRNKGFRPDIQGGDATIVAGVYINLTSMIRTNRLTVTGIAILDLGGVTIRTGKNYSALVELNLGVDLPNLPAIFKDIESFFSAMIAGNYDAALKMVFTQDMFFKSMALLRWLLRTFTTLGKPVDLIWSLLTLIASAPSLIDQVISLFNQKTVEKHQIYALIAAANNIATQGLMLEGQIENFGDFNSVELHWQSLTSSLALDVMALVLPFSSNSSLLQFQSGLQVGFTDIDRSAFSFSIYNACLAINKTNMFYLSNQQQQLVLASSVASIGTDLTTSGTTIAGTVYTNVVTQNDSSNTIAKQINDQARDLNLKGAKLTADQIILHSDHSTTVDEDSKLDAHERLTSISEGDITDTGNMHATQLVECAAHDLTTSGNTSADTAEIQAGHNAALNGNIDTKTQFSTKAGHDLTTSSNSHITGSESKAELISANNTKLNGSVETKSVYSESGNDTTVSGPITVSKEVHMAANHNMQLDADITNTAKDDNAEPASTFSAGNNLKTGNHSNIQAEHSGVAAEAKNNMVLSGHRTIETFQAKAGGNLVDTATSTVTAEKLQASGSVEEAGETKFTNEATPVLIVEGNTVDFTNDSKTSGNGTVKITGDSGSIHNIDVDNLAVSFKHLPNIEDLLQSKGLYESIHARLNIAASTTDEFKVDRDLNLTIGASVTASSVEVNNNVHSTGSLAFTSTVGGIRIGEYKVAADDILTLDSHDNIIGDKSTLTGYEVAMQAMHCVVNNGGHWGGLNYFSINAGGDVKINCLSSDVKGEYGPMKSYQPGYLIGGLGEGHGGVGLFVQTDGKFIVLGSSVMSQGSNNLNAKGGFDLEGLYNQYISYYRYYHNWTGRTSETTDYSYQLQPAVIYSQNGANNLVSSDGSLYSVSTQFFAAKETNLTAKYDVSLLGYVLEQREVKDRGHLYIFDKKTDQRDQFAVPTQIVTPDNVHITSQCGSINQLNAAIRAGGTVTERAADTIDIEAPLLDHSMTIETRGLTFDSPLLDGANAQPLGQDYQAMTQARCAVEWSAAISNSVIDSLNFANSILAGLARGSMLQGVFQASNLASAEVGYSHTKASYKTQTVAENSGTEAANVALNSKTVKIGGGAEMKAERDMSIEGDKVILRGAERHSSSQIGTQSAALGVSLQGDPTASASVSGSVTRETDIQNQHLSAGGSMTVKTRTLEMDGANINGNEVEIDADTLNMKTKTGESSSHSWSANASTSGNFGVQNATSHATTMNEATGIHATKNLNMNVNALNSTGAKVVSDGTGNLYIKNINAAPVHVESSSRSNGFSGNINDLPADKSDSNADSKADSESEKTGFQQGITTASVSHGEEDSAATQKTTIFVASGTGLHGAAVSGDLNTKDNSGYTQEKNTKENFTTKIPTNTSGVKELETNAAAAKNALFPSANTPHTMNHQSQELDNKNDFEDKPIDTTKIFRDSLANDLKAEDDQQQNTAPKDVMVLELTKYAGVEPAANDDKSASSSWVDEMANSQVVTDILALRAGTIKGLSAGAEAVAKGVKDVVVLDFYPSDSKEFQDAANDVTQGIQTAKTVGTSVLRFGDDTATMMVTPSDSEMFQAAATRMGERLDDVKNQGIQIVDDARNEDQATLLYQVGLGIGSAATLAFNGEFAEMADATIGGVGAKAYDYVKQTQIRKADTIFQTIKSDPVRGAMAARQEKLLADDVGYVVATPICFTRETIGLDGTYITDYHAIHDAIGPFKPNVDYSVGMVTFGQQVNYYRARMLALSLGVQPERFLKGFRVAEVPDLKSYNPASPLRGNEFFTHGAGLPLGGPEVWLEDALRTEHFPWAPNTNLASISEEELADATTHLDESTHHQHLQAEDKHSPDEHPGERSELTGLISKIGMFGQKEHPAEFTLVNRYTMRVDHDTGFSDDSINAGKVKTIEERLDYAKLPHNPDRVCFIPDKQYRPSNQLPKYHFSDDTFGYIDRDKNIWVKGPSRTKGDAFEWDVQLSHAGQNKYRHLIGNAKYMNVSLDGRITHGLIDKNAQENTGNKRGKKR